MKKIVHIMMGCFYVEGMGYQENILPKKHKELGFDVSIIASQYAPFQNAKNETRASGTYINNNGIKVTILPFSKWYQTQSNFLMKFSVFMRKYAGLHHALDSIAPDIIFVHGLQAIDTMDVVKYKKGHQDVKIYVDQHGDYYNMPINRFPNFLIQKVLYAAIANRISKCSEIMWGVTPWRVKYLQDVYGIPSEKTGFLPLGGDDSLIDFANRDSIRTRIREKYQIKNTDFLVVSGGKIDKTKNIHLLMQAVYEMDVPDVKLLIFGKPENDMMEEVEKWSSSCDKIILAGWIPSDEAYNYFMASDLGVFPGTHSVLWEQAVSTGLPCLFKHWEGMEHIDVGGNAILLDEPANDQPKYKDMMVDLIRTLSNKGDEYVKMKFLSESKGVKTFSYLEIAKRSIQLEDLS